jgi:excinuclease ABC subunit C
MECFDVSHTMGERTVASCVVFGPQGPLKSDYRRFNIDGLAPGDDYGALRQALSRRYARIKKGEAPLPDLLLIDGGPGQLAEAVAVLKELEIDGLAWPASPRAPTAGQGRSACSSSAKSSRASWPPIRRRCTLSSASATRRTASRSPVIGSAAPRLDAFRAGDGPGLGPRKRRELLRQFGGLQGVARAGVDDLAKVHGIGRKLAQSIYDTLHASG